MVLLRASEDLMELTSLVAHVSIVNILLLNKKVGLYYAVLHAGNKLYLKRMNDPLKLYSHAYYVCASQLLQAVAIKVCCKDHSGSARIARGPRYYF